MSTKPVLITTQHRGVFAGLIPVDQDLSVKAMPLKSARMAIYWGTSKGVMELCDTGPTSKSRISAPADQPLAFQPRRIERTIKKPGDVVLQSWARPVKIVGGR